MSRPCAESAAVGTEMLATVAVAVTALRQHLIDPDPKVALRAVAELTKLLGVCARHGLAVEEVRKPVPLEAAPPATPTAEAEPADPGRKRERRHDDVPSKMPLPGGRGSQDPSLAPPAPNLPSGGRTLTSFLGSPAAKADAG